jgi:hypothetical protein
VVHQEKYHPPGEEEEHVNGERVRRAGRPAGIDYSGYDEEDQRAGNQVPRVQPGPDRVDHVGSEEPEERIGVREGHGCSVSDVRIVKKPKGWMPRRKERYNPKKALPGWRPR